MTFPPRNPHRERDPPHLWKNEPPSESENQEPDKVHLTIRESLLATRSETGDIHRRFCSARKFRSFNAVKAIPPVCLGVPYISTENFRFLMEQIKQKIGQTTAKESSSLSSTAHIPHVISSSKLRFAHWLPQRTPPHLDSFLLFILPEFPAWKRMRISMA